MQRGKKEEKIRAPLERPLLCATALAILARLVPSRLVNDQLAVHEQSRLVHTAARCALDAAPTPPRRKNLSLAFLRVGGDLFVFFPFSID